MTSATLYREGEDLDALLAELDTQYPGRVRVLEVLHPREGGFMGFFSKQLVGVSYRLLSDQEVADHHAARANHTANKQPASKQASDERDHTSAAASSQRPRTTEAAPSVPGAEAATSPSASNSTDSNAAGQQFAQLLADLAIRRAREDSSDLDLPAAPAAATGPTADAVAKATKPAAAESTPQATQPAEPFWATPNSPELARKTRAASQHTPATPRADSRESLRQALGAQARSTKTADTTPLAPAGGAASSKATVNGEATAAAAARRSGTSLLQKDPAPFRPRTIDKDGSPAGNTATRPSTTSAAPAQPASTSPRPFGSRPPAASAAPPTDGSTSGHSATLALRRQLLEIGVPVDRVPGDAIHAYQAIENLVATLPPAPTPPRGPGQILVIAGRAAELAAAVMSVLDSSELQPAAIWAYRCDGMPGSERLPNLHTIHSANSGATLAAKARADESGPVVALVATDRAGDWDNGASAVIEALSPDALWAVVDATRKPVDTRRVLAQTGTPTALIVTDAHHSLSPATVWELDVPIAIVDGRTSSSSTWAVLMLDTLNQMDQTCSDALS